ncbi:MAG: hypothetical protein KAU16_00160 [Methanophagales archaeon]|nr:hypothetical protein [Methanophagales archaeon]
MNPKNRKGEWEAVLAEIYLSLNEIVEGPESYSGRFTEPQTKISRNKRARRMEIKYAQLKH